MELLIQNQELVLIASAIVILLIAIFLIAMLSYKFKKYAEYTNETFDRYKSIFSQHEIMFEVAQKQINELQSWGLLLDRSLSQINETLNKPLYEEGNIVDFTDVDSNKILTGKIFQIKTLGHIEPYYYVEVEKGVYFDIKQSQITAWTN